jgi:hypothetical protein
VRSYRLRSTALDGAAILASSRTYTLDGARSYGVAIDPVSGAGDAVPGRTLALGLNEAVQWNDVFAEMSTSPLEQASLLVDVLDGGSATAWATLVDNRTNDGSYFPATLVP